MASRLTFDVETLKSNIEKKYEQDIANAQQTLDDMKSFDLTQAVNDWREMQERRISELFRRLGGDDIANEELAEFHIESIPSLPTEYALAAAERELNNLQRTRDKKIARANAVVPTDGTLALTPTELRDFFGV